MIAMRIVEPAGVLGTACRAGGACFRPCLGVVVPVPAEGDQAFQRWLVSLVGLDHLRRRGGWGDRNQGEVREVEDGCLLRRGATVLAGDAQAQLVGLRERQAGLPCAGFSNRPPRLAGTSVR